MLNVTSKIVIALKGTPLIYEEPFNQVQNWLNHRHPNMPFHNNKYDSGKPRQTDFSSWLGLDSQNERAPNRGAGMSLGRDPNESQDQRLSSGYNDGEQADDETGPGHSSEIPDPYFTSDVANDVFMDLRLKNKDRSPVATHLLKMRTQMPVTLPHKRYQVDMI